MKKSLKAFLLGVAILLVIHCIVGVLLFYAAWTENSQLLNTLATITNIMSLITVIIVACSSLFTIFILIKVLHDD